MRGREARERDTGYPNDFARICSYRPPTADLVPLGNKIARWSSQP
jgi:hypothetical protein